MADGDLKLSNSPNVDTGYVEKDGSLHRSLLVATPEGTLELSDNPNVDTGYMTDSDGKKHKVRLTAVLAGGGGSSLPDQTGNSGKFLTTDGTDASWASIPVIQVSTMPTASATEEGKIYQFIGTTDANYTNGYFYKCISDGQNPATYSWEQVNVQPAPSGLPSQTGNAGKFLTTDGTDASWSDTITGLKIVNSSDNTKYTTVSSDGNFFLQDGSHWRRFQLAKKTSPKQINFILATDDTGSATTIGASNSKIDLVYTTKINNGADIAVPTTGGTMAVIGVNTTITLASANWSANSQTVSVTGMTATAIVFVSPTPASQSDYTTAGIICTAQAAGTLTFSCDTTPTNDITVNVVAM